MTTNPDRVPLDAPLPGAARHARLEPGKHEKRPLVHQVGVSPTIRIGVDDSHTLVLIITSPDGAELQRTTLSNGDRLAEAVIVARSWVATQEHTAQVERVMEATSRDLSKRRPQ